MVPERTFHPQRATLAYILNSDLRRPKKKDAKKKKNTVGESFQLTVSFCHIFFSVGKWIKQYP